MYCVYHLHVHMDLKVYNRLLYYDIMLYIKMNFVLHLEDQGVTLKNDLIKIQTKIKIHIWTLNGRLRLGN